MVTDVPQDLTNLLQLRVRKSYLIIGAVSAIGFAGFGIWSVFASALNIDGSFPHPVLIAIFAGFFWGGWFLASLYVVAAYFREKLTVTSQSITQKGVFRTRATAISDVTSVKWRAWPVGGSIVIRYPHSRMTIHFDNFITDEREQLISCLRELISEDCQANWDVFVSSQQPAPAHPQESRGSAILCMALFFIMAAVFLYCWLIQYAPSFLVIGVACGLAGVWYVFRILKFVPDSESELTA